MVSLCRWVCHVICMCVSHHMIESETHILHVELMIYFLFLFYIFYISSTSDIYWCLVLHCSVLACTHNTCYTETLSHAWEPRKRDDFFLFHRVESLFVSCWMWNKKMKINKSELRSSAVVVASRLLLFVSRYATNGKRSENVLKSLEMRCMVHTAHCTVKRIRE